MELGNVIADDDLELDFADFPSIDLDELVNVMVNVMANDLACDECKFDFDFAIPDLATILDAEGTPDLATVLDTEAVETQKLDSVELPKPKQRCGKGKEMATLIRHYKSPASPPPTKIEIVQGIPKNEATKNEAPKNGYQPQNWNDEAKLEGTKRKLHQLYDEDKAKKRKIQVIDLQSLPKPKPKPVRRVNKSKGKGFRANHCPVF